MNTIRKNSIAVEIGADEITEDMISGGRPIKNRNAVSGITRNHITLAWFVEAAADRVVGGVQYLNPITLIGENATA